MILIIGRVEAVIESRQHLIHTLHIHHTWVQPCVQEQNSTHYICMCDDIVSFEVSVEVSFPIFGLFCQLVLIVSILFIICVSEELHISSGPAYVLLNLLPYNIIFKVFVPNALLPNAERVIIIIILVIFVFILQVWYDNIIFF